MDNVIGSNLSDEARQKLVELESAYSAAKAEAQASANAAVEAQKQAVTARADAQAKLAEITLLARDALTAKTQVLDAQAVIATKSDHIEGAQKHADQVRGDLDKALTVANKSVSDAEAHRVRAESAAGQATGSLAEFRSAKAALDIETAAIGAAKKIAEESSVSTKALADKAEKIESKITDYEAQLAALYGKNEAQAVKIEELLRGATNVGLAKSFDARRQTFLKPQGRWQLIFVGSVLVIVGLTVTGLWHFFSTNTVPTYDELVS